MAALGIDEEMSEDRDVGTGHPRRGMARGFINFKIFFRGSHVPEVPFPRNPKWIPDFELWRSSKHNNSFMVTSLC